LSPTRVGISLMSYAPSEVTGATTYIVGLTRALVARRVFDYVLFCSPRHLAVWRQMLGPDVRIVAGGPGPRSRILRVLYERLVFPKTARRNGVGIVLFLMNAAPLPRPIRTIATVYDLLLLQPFNDYPWHKRVYLHRVFHELARRQGHVLTISEFCRRDIHARLGLDLDRITVASPGIDPEFVESVGQTPAGNLPPTYLLSVAGAFPHKRLHLLIDAFRTLAVERPELHLVLAGTHVGRDRDRTALRAHAMGTGIASRIHFLPPLPRESLPGLFSGAAALATSSEFEGFGIPVLEAMAVGCPVAAAPAEAVIEVLGGQGWIAADPSVESMTQAIRCALDARTKAPEVIERARRRALTTFTWDHAATAVEQAMTRISGEATSRA
jgi:glycosyltransferase involved in cell wall biosynthesis